MDIETQLAIENSREHLIDFSIVMDHNYEVNWHHRDIAEKLEAVERGEIKRLIITVPPRCGKSQLASINFPAWYLGRNPDKEIITASYSGDLATDFGGKTRELIDDAQYQQIFTNIKLKQDEKSKGKWKTNKKGSYTSVGVGGATTGRGANIFIIDDPLKNREEADSEVIREKVWKWYTSTAYTRLEKNGAVILILTRWHLDDLAGRLIEAMNDGSGDDWTIVNYPAIAEENEIHRVIGEPLWENKYDLEALNGIKNVIGLLDWSALYQQMPILSELQEFKQNYFRYFEESDIIDKSMFIDILIDPAVAQNEQACETGIEVIAHEEGQPKLFLIDDLSGMYDPYELEKLVSMKVEDYQREYPNCHVRVHIEAFAVQTVFISVFKREMSLRKKFYSINPMKGASTKGAKEMRIRGLIPLYRAGLIFHRPMLKSGILETQLCQFPFGKLIDRCDALSYIVQVKNPVVRDKRKKRQENYNPENSLTGY